MSCTAKSYNDLGLIIEDFQLPVIDPADLGWKMDQAQLTPTDTTLDIFASGGEGHQESYSINYSTTLETRLHYVGAAAPGVAENRLAELCGDDRRVSIHPHSTTLTPATDDPVIGFYAHVPRFRRGGEGGQAMTWEHTIMVSGTQEYLETPLPAPTNEATTGGVGQVTVEWDSDATFLTKFPTTLQIRGYNVWRSGTPGGSPADPYLKINLAEVANPGDGSTVSYVDTVAAGTYYYKVQAVWEFGVLSEFSAEVSGIAS